jgi:hypothetical protein
MEESDFVIGFPSGEVIYVNDNELYVLYENDLIKTNYEHKCFEFDDKKRQTIMIFVKTKQNKE